MHDIKYCAFQRWGLCYLYCILHNCSNCQSKTLTIRTAKIYHSHAQNASFCICICLMCSVHKKLHLIIYVLKEKNRKTLKYGVWGPNEQYALYTSEYGTFSLPSCWSRCIICHQYSAHVAFDDECKKQTDSSKGFTMQIELMVAKWNDGMMKDGGSFGMWRLPIVFEWQRKRAEQY